MGFFITPKPQALCNRTGARARRTRQLISVNIRVFQLVLIERGRGARLPPVTNSSLRAVFRSRFVRLPSFDGGLPDDLFRDLQFTNLQTKPQNVLDDYFQLRIQ